MAINKVVYGAQTLIDISDTTAVASDVAQGKEFYGADGSKVVGTASGGITPTGTLSITENGTYDVTNYASANVNVSGGELDETLLWENPDPTKMWGSTQTATSVPSITLSESYSNFEYIKLRYSPSNTSTTIIRETYYPTHYYYNNIKLTSMPEISMLSAPYARGMTRSNDTTYSVYPSKTLSLSAGTINNKYCIPVAIYGVGRK